MSISASFVFIIITMSIYFTGAMQREQNAGKLDLNHEDL